jgi:choline dehydrogenase-like flavoprotein
MVHPVFRLGVFRPTNRQIFNSAGLYDLHWANDSLVMGKLTLTEAAMRHRQLLNSCMILVPRPKVYESEAVKSFRILSSSSRRAKVPKDAFQHLSNAISGIDDIATYIYRRAFKLRKFPYSLKQGGWSRFSANHKRFSSFEVMTATEQAPNPDIRVMLSDDRDRLGLRKVQPIRWRWQDLEIQNHMQVQQILKEEIARAGLGQFQSWMELTGDTKPKCHGGDHHMGTTRMHIDPKQGVVDENCRVHGVSNLFVAGSSVFPTGGYANPTLTIVALAIRLADRVTKMMTANAIALR